MAERVLREESTSIYVYLIAAVAAMGGLLFGFDTAVINGAIVFLRQEFHLTEFQTEMAAGSLLLGCVFGALAGGTLSDRLGRKRLLIASAALFLVSAIGAAIPRNLTQFVVARLVGGLAIGVASAMSPLYIAELAPAHIRGRLVTLNQLAIVIGILVSFFVNWSLASLGSSSWRWMFAVAGVPSLVFLITLLLVPESPRWLVQRERIAEALGVLERVAGPAQAAEQMKVIRHSIAQEQAGSLASLIQPPLRRPLMIAVALAVFSQITGINTILYYGSLIFSEQVKTQSTSSALWANVVIGAINLAGTVVAILLIDRAGRRPLLLTAVGGMGAALFALGIAFRIQPPPAVLILALILTYVACFAVGLGPGSWLVMSELFPTHVRGRAMSIATISLWLACLAITLTFLSMVSWLGAAGAFWTYATLCAAAFFFIWRAVPETKGRTLEEIQQSWGR
jgi:sugar porter (SP) family MFS transporter